MVSKSSVVRKSFQAGSPALPRAFGLRATSGSTIALAWLAFTLGEASFGADESARTPRSAVEERAAPDGRDTWGRYVRTVRREHHLALMTGIQDSYWQLTHFGQIENKRPHLRGVSLRLDYSFHLEAWRKFAVSLGTTLGYGRNGLESARDRGAFQAQNYWQLPGLAVGLCWNLDPVWRILLDAQVYLLRYEDILDRTQPGDPQSLSASLAVAPDVGVALDYFYSLRAGIRVETRWRRALYQRPALSGGRPEDAKFLSWDRTYGLGLVYHLL